MGLWTGSAKRSFRLSRGALILHKKVRVEKRMTKKGRTGLWTGSARWSFRVSGDLTIT